MTLASQPDSSDTTATAVGAQNESAFDPARETLTGEPSESEDESPPQREKSRWPAMLVGALLTIALGAQSVVGWRNEIAARLPSTAPILTQLMAPFGWSVSAPRHRAALNIESFELRAATTAGEFDLLAVLSNRATHPVALPALELTLTDSAGAVMLRKVLTASDYAHSPQGASTDLPGQTERAVRLRMALNGPVPAGYTADVFYP